MGKIRRKNGQAPLTHRDVQRGKTLSIAPNQVEADAGARESILVRLALTKRHRRRRRSTNERRVARRRQ